MTDDKVILFPINDNQLRELAAKYEDDRELPVINQERLKKVSYLNVNSQLIIELLYETLEEMGFDCREEKNMKDFHCIVEMLKGFMARQLDIEHPLHDLMDHLVSQIED